jgi:class 3 adenylate cyclase/WD40 repeat protein
VATRTFLFVDQVGSTEQLTLLGDATAHGIRRALFDLLRQATEVAGGQEVDFTGDGLFCAFDGAAEAVDAAVAMQQLAWSFNGRRPEAHRVSIRAGLNSGEPLESEGGGYFGTAVVVAARLCSAAVAGQVLVSALVRGLVEPRGVHVFEPVGRLDLKGVPVPVEASAVAWTPDARRAPLPRPLVAARTPWFVGRRLELAAVEAAWERAAAGERPLVALSGDHGAGVTCLAAEAAALLHARGASVWAGHGQGPEARLAPWAEAVAEWAAAVPRAELRLALGDRAGDLLRLVPGLADLVPRLPPPPAVDPAAELYLIADALDDLVARWSAIEPLVVVLDSLEEADAGTLTVLRRLASSTRGGRVLLIAGYEPSSVGTPRVLAALQEAAPTADLRLGGLAEGDVRGLVEAVTGEPVGSASLRAVLAESEGSPYFVLEMARSLRERGLAEQVQERVDRAGELRIDLRLQREEITLALRELDQVRESGAARSPVRLDPDGTPPVPGSSPYPGLLAFTAADADAFAGRDALVAEMVAALVSARWLAVVGPSGSGKSSAVRAGLLPALARGALPGSAGWTTAVCTPGPDPVAGLARALTGHGPTDEATARLEHEPLAALVPEPVADRRVVLVVDQFEELWTTAPPAARDRVVDLLVEAATAADPRVLVVVCLRADHYGPTAAHPGLARLMAESQVLVSPMTTGELRAAVEQPARLAGWVLEPGLAQAVVDDVRGEPGALPLLSTAMLETWERRRGRSLTLAGYAETGGARGAIAALADATLDELSPGDREVARRLLLRLATPTAEGTDVARPARLAELAVDEPTRRVLGRLAERRLVTVGGSTVQVAHEALLREWPRLRRWLEADRDGRRLHLQIASAATDWAASDRDDGVLLRGARLAAAEDWRVDHAPELTAAEQEFLSASVRARHRQVRRLRGLTGVLVVLLVGALVAGVLAVARGREATARATEATARGLAAQARSLAATRLDTALLLAVEGWRRAPSLDTEGGLLTALDAARHLRGYREELPPDPLDTELSADGATLAVLTASGDVQLYDPATWRPRGDPLVRGVQAPGYLEFAGSGELLAYGDAAGGHLVDVTNGEAAGPALGGGPFTRVVFGPADAVVGVDGGSTPAVFRVTDPRTGAVRAELAAETGALRPGAAELAVALPGPETVLQRASLDGTPIGDPVQLPGGGGTSLRYTPDGDRLVVLTVDGITLAVDADTLAPLGPPIGGETGRLVMDADVSPDGEWVALAADDGSVRVASTRDGSVRASMAGLGQTAPVAFLDDHRLLALVPGRSVEYDVDDLTPVGRSAELGHPLSRLLPVPGGDRALAGVGRELVEVDPSGRVTPTGIELPVELEGPMALSPDGRRVAALGYPPGSHYLQDNVVEPDGILVVADRRTGEVLVQTAVAGDEGVPVEGAAAFSPDGRQLAVGTWGGVLTVLDSGTGKVLVERRTDVSALRGLLWSPDGDVLYASGGDGVLRFLDPATGQPEAEVPLTPGQAVNAITAVPGTALLAATGDTGQVFLVDTEHRAVVGEPLASEATQLLALAASPDGSRLAATSWDGALRLWDRASGRALAPPLAGHAAFTRAVVWSAADQLLTGSFTGTLIAWDLAPAHWVDRACTLAGRDLTRAEWTRYLPDEPYRRTCSAGR